MSFWQIYALTNVLFAIGYLLVRSVEGLERLVYGRMGLIDQQTRLKMFRTLYLVCLVAPFVAFALPNWSLASWTASGWPRLDELRAVAEVAPSSLRRLEETFIATARIPLALGSGIDWADHAWTLLQVVLGAGALLHLVRLGRDVRRLRRLLRRALPIKQLGRVQVGVTNETAIPLSAWSQGQAHVLLPDELGARPNDFLVALHHELQHHRQGDTRFIYCLAGVGALFFWNPFVALWQRRLIELQEFACDEALVGRRRHSPQAYGGCLLRVAEGAVGARVHPVCANGMARSRPSKRNVKILQRRIEMLFQYKSDAGRSRGWVFGLAATLGLGMLGVAYAGAQVWEDGSARESSEAPAVTVDMSLQQKVADLLRDGVAHHEARGALAIVGEPATGRILAAVKLSRPDATSEPREETPTEALAQALPLGSIVKPFIIAAAIDRGLITADTVITCAEGVTLGGEPLGDGQCGSRLTTRELLEKSSNLCAVTVARQVGSPTLPNELKGYGFSLADAGEDDELVSLAVGQSVSASAQTIWNSFATLARRGEKGDEPFGISPQTSEIMASMLEGVVLNGTGQAARMEGIRVAGKTATFAKVDAQSGMNTGRTLAEFAGFLPAEQPNLVIFVAVDEPSREGRTGGAVAAPLFRQIAEAALGTDSSK